MLFGRLRPWPIALLVAGCSAEKPQGAEQTTDPVPLTAASDGADWRSWPAKERAAHIAAVQARAGDEFAFRAQGTSRYEGQHAGMMLRSTFAPAQALVGGVNWALAAVGCAGEMSPLGPTAPSQAATPGNRVTFAHSRGVDEWYVNGSLGVEQGFTLNELPECARSGKKLFLRLSSSAGWRVSAAPDGSRALLLGPDGERIHYGEAYAEDARGTPLAVRLLGGEALGLELDAANAVPPLHIDPLIFTEIQALTPSDGGSLGARAALSGETALLQGVNKGYVFARSGTTWGEQQLIVGPNGSALQALALSGDTVLAGAPLDDLYQGSAYVFARSGATWTEQQKLTASDGVVGDQFGYSVSISGNSALIGAAYPGDFSLGWAYVFVRSGTTWTEQQKLTAPDGAPTNHHFGFALALDGDTALIGASIDPSQTGTAYVFVRSGTTWTQQQKLTASDNPTGALFGSNVVLDGERALISTQQGLIYVFDRSGTTWTEQSKINVPVATSMALSGDRSLVGSPDQGAAYVFALNAGAWAEQQALTAAGAMSGTAVALTDTRALVGSVSSAHVFELLASNGDACALAEDCVSGYCADGVCCDVACLGQCEACAEPDHAGECVAVSGEPRGEREVCAGGEPACAKRCDGQVREECTFVEEGTVCGSSCTDEVIFSECDGQGSCVQQPGESCSPYVCANDACRSDCETDTDCAAGFDCTNADCVPAKNSCSPSGAELLDAEGNVAANCMPYRCEGAVCLDACGGSSDCLSGYVCNPGTSVCEKTDSSPQEESGCACRSASGSGSSPFGFAAVLLAIVAAARRSSRRTTRPVQG